MTGAAARGERAARNVHTSTARITLFLTHCLLVQTTFISTPPRTIRFDGGVSEIQPVDICKKANRWSAIL
jgi:hypothetical protein